MERGPGNCNANIVFMFPLSSPISFKWDGTWMPSCHLIFAYFIKLASWLVVTRYTVGSELQGERFALTVKGVKSRGITRRWEPSLAGGSQSLSKSKLGVKRIKLHSPVNSILKIRYRSNTWKCFYVIPVNIMKKEWNEKLIIVYQRNDGLKCLQFPHCLS